METLSYVGNKEGLMEYLEEEGRVLSDCCNAPLVNGFCGDCGEHA